MREGGRREKELEGMRQQKCGEEEEEEEAAVAVVPG